VDGPHSHHSRRYSQYHPGPIYRGHCPGIHGGKPSGGYFDCGKNPAQSRRPVFSRWTDVQTGPESSGGKKKNHPNYPGFKNYVDPERKTKSDFQFRAYSRASPLGERYSFDNHRPGVSIC
jgi:hypothetical protein